ncbi:MAG: hypothetical protein R6V01_03515 [Thermoplasmatota archaeon]
MQDPICPEIMSNYTSEIENFHCRGCGSKKEVRSDLKNSDEVLKKAVPLARENRKEWGLEGLIKGLQAVIINTENEKLVPASQELLDFTGYKLSGSFEDRKKKSILLGMEGSADIIVRHRKHGKNPFVPYNIGPKTEHMPNTRLETLVFECSDIERYFRVQMERGVRFLQDEIVHNDNYSFIQTVPSSYTGNSIGFIQWKGKRGDYMNDGDSEMRTTLEKKNKDYLKNMKQLDHSATRLGSMDRDAAIIEFVELTNYDFDFAIYVKSFNSITNVARLTKDGYAQVFTTGIEPFRTLETSGPTENYVHNYGPRIHHMAFHTENIEDSFEALVQDGMEFLLELVGSPEEGLKQTFTKGSKNTFLVNEYIHRYGDFDGFFTNSNVTELTRATDAQ